MNFETGFVKLSSVQYLVCDANGNAGQPHIVLILVSRYPSPRPPYSIGRPSPGGLDREGYEMSALAIFIFDNIGVICYIG